MCEKISHFLIEIPFSKLHLEKISLITSVYVGVLKISKYNFYFMHSARRLITDYGVIDTNFILIDSINKAL